MLMACLFMVSCATLIWGVVQLFNAVADRQKELKSKVGKMKELGQKKGQAKKGLGSDDVKHKLKNEDPEMNEKSGGGWNARKKQYEAEDGEDGSDSSIVFDDRRIGFD
uniref:Uncharacterized protein n=1 Tax=Plectus sambesii TaxID=2011161 RepID=A0A914W3I5_9BILA